MEEHPHASMAGQKMTWDELAEMLEVSRRENSTLAAQLELIMKGMAELFPKEGWTTGPHPELGDMTDQFAEHILSKVRRLNRDLVDAYRKAAFNTREAVIAEEAGLAWQKKLAEVQLREQDTRAAARVAIASVHDRIRALRTFMEPEHFVQVWNDVIREESKSPSGVFMIPDWSDLPESTRKNMTRVCTRIQELQAQAEDASAKSLDKIAEQIIGEGEELAGALLKIAQATDILREFWDSGVVHLTRSLNGIGMGFLPPGTIVHNAKPSQAPHRPY